MGLASWREARITFGKVSLMSEHQDRDAAIGKLLGDLGAGSVSQSVVETGANHSAGEHIYLEYGPRLRRREYGGRNSESA
jgi:hypothetical protein